MSTPSPAKNDRQMLIGRYEVVKRIGAGGMGAVYKAVHLDLGRTVALKVLPTELAIKPDMLERFKQEARSAAKLRHEHIVTLFEFDEVNGTHFLAMEYVEGCNLHEYIDKKGKLEPEEARQILIQAARALALAHEHHIVHRDIKPSNFLLTIKDGKPFIKLTDFGLARSIDDTDFKVTRTGTTVGTVDYISPEQARNSRAADIRSDIYSLGCTLYHMLAGRPPFPEGDLTERLLKHVEAEPQDVREFCPTVPAGLVEVLKKMLAKKPESRYQTPLELVQDLENLPSGPPLSAMAALEALAKASGEKPKSARSASAVETRRHTVKDPTRPLTVPSAPVVPPTKDIKLRYRKSRQKNTRALEGTDGDGTMTSPVVIQGMLPWILVIGGVSAIVLIGMAIAFKWGGTPALKTTDDDKTVAKAGPDKKDDIDKGAKKTFAEVKKVLKGKQEGENSAERRAAAEKLVEDQGLPKIQTPSEDVLRNLQQQFPTKARGSFQQDPEIARNFYGGQANVIPGGDPGGAGSVPSSPGGVAPVLIQPGAGTGEASREPTNPSGAGQGGTPAPNKSTEAPTKAPETQNPNPRLENPPSPSAGRGNAAGTKTSAESGGATQGPKPTSTPPPSKQTPTTASSSQKPVVAENPAGQGKTNTGTGTPARTVAQRPAPLVVSRVGIAGSGQGFDSLAAALARAGSMDSNDPITIEIQDNGPLFAPAMSIASKSIVLRGGAGYRPVVAWDTSSAASTKAGYLLTVANGNLVLENLDLVVRSADTGDSAISGLVRVTDGSVLVESCSFSIAGRHRAAVSAIWLEGTPADRSRPRCYLNRCVFRGAEMTAINLQAPGAEMMMDSCLLVGGTRPLLHVLGRVGSVPTSLRVARSTLVSAQNVVSIKPANSTDRLPTVHWLSWDSLLARFGNQDGGEMIELQDEATAAAMQWKAINCLYTGWQVLLKYAGGKIGPENLAAWNELWHTTEGEKVLGGTWPAFMPAEPEKAQPAAFRTSGTSAAYRDSTGTGAIGCDVTLVPVLRENWLNWTYEVAAIARFDARFAEQPPEINHAAADTRFQGGKLDLSRYDLGEFLQDLHDARRLAPRVVMHLAGKGSARSTPFRLKDTTLVLYFEETVDRLEIAPKPGGTHDALIAIENGGLDLIGGSIVFPSSKSLALPSYLIKMQNGDLRVHGCRLQGPVGEMPASFRGLISFTGSGATALDRARDCSIGDSILISGKEGLQTIGTGVRVRMHNCVLVAGGNAFHIDPGMSPVLRLNGQWLLDHLTVAAKGAVFHCADAQALAAPVEPSVLQARSSLFLACSDTGTGPAGLLRFEDRALPRGLLVWQGELNAYDNRLGYFVLPDHRQQPPAGQTGAVLAQIWGPTGERRGLTLDLAQAKPVAIDPAGLERLALPEAVKAKVKGTPPGADLGVLGITRRAGRGGR